MPMLTKLVICATICELNNIGFAHFPSQLGTLISMLSIIGFPASSSYNIASAMITAKICYESKLVTGLCDMMKAYTSVSVQANHAQEVK